MGTARALTLTADRLAHFQGVKVHQHPPESNEFRAYCRNADKKEAPKPFLERDQDIVDWSEVLIATPSEETGEKLRSGTWATVRMARKKGIPIIIVRPSGKVEQE